MYHKYVVVSSKKRSIKRHLLLQLFLHVKFLGTLGGGVGNLVVNQEIILLRELIDCNNQFLNTKFCHTLRVCMLFDNFVNKQVKNQGLKSSSVSAG